MSVHFGHASGSSGVHNVSFYRGRCDVTNSGLSHSLDFGGLYIALNGITSRLVVRPRRTVASNKNKKADGRRK